MPINQQFASASAVPVVNAVETTVVVSPPINLQGSQQVVIDGTVDLTAGASTTAMNVRIRRGALASGALVAFVSATLAAGSRLVLPICFNDSFAGDVAGQVYNVTCQQTAGSANGTANTATILLQF